MPKNKLSAKRIIKIKAKWDKAVDKAIDEQILEPKNKIKEEWRSEFRRYLEKWLGKNVASKDEGGEWWGFDTNYGDMKVEFLEFENVIANLLASQRRQIRKEVGEIVKKYKCGEHKKLMRFLKKSYDKTPTT